MIDIYNYIEIGHVECTECNTSLDWDAVDDAIRKYGLIALYQESTCSAYFGYTCPHCIKTSLHETDENFLRFLISGDLSNPDGLPQHPKGPNLFAYESLNLSEYSYHLRYEYHCSRIFNDIIKNEETKTIAYRHSFGPGNISVDKLIDRNTVYRNLLYDYYCSFVHGTSFFSTAPMVQFFFDDPQLNEEESSWEQNHWLLGRLEKFLQIELVATNGNVIKKCQGIENTTGKKIFNRYVLADPLYSKVNDFCIKREYPELDGYRHFKAEKEQNQPPKKLDLISSFLDKLILQRASEFLKILFISDLFYLLQAKERGFSVPLRYPTDKMKLDLEKLSTIYSGIWSNFFNKQKINILESLLYSFIQEYFKYKKKIDCTFDDVWNLSQYYLNMVHNFLVPIPEQKKYGYEILNKLVDDFNSLTSSKDIKTEYPSLNRIITNSSNIVAIKNILLRIARKERQINRFMLLGETGTGKELFAKAIHEINEREGSFIPVNCAAIPDQMFESEFFGHVKGAFTGAVSNKAGYFEQADNGTIFLDEIGELDLKFQARFLRVLQENEFTPVGGKTKKSDFLLITATHRDLRQMVEDGTFREDLYQRLNLYCVDIPPLSERADDIPILAEYFFRKYDTELDRNLQLEPLSLSRNTISQLEQRQWRGNIRELERACRIAIAFRDPKNRSEINISELKLEEEVLPKTTKSKNQKKQKVIKKVLPGNTKVTHDEVKQAMKNNNGNKSQTAKELGVTYHTILRKCKELGI